MAAIEYLQAFLAICFALLAIWFGNELRIRAAMKNGQTRSIMSIKEQEDKADNLRSKLSPNTEWHDSQSYNVAVAEIKKFENDPL